jgi:hypothetical protein
MSTAPSGLAQIGKSVVIKGELSGSEDLYVDGQVDGSIALKGNSLTVGPNGQAWWFRENWMETFRLATGLNCENPRWSMATSAPSESLSKKAPS